ncbi:MAG: MGDG synthase family glycosyltransferase, partial [Methylococcaceae bacterium]
MAANTGLYRNSATSLPGDPESPLPADSEGRRVLIMSVGAGNGHIRAAQALEQRFATDGRVTEVINCDVLQYTNTLFRNFYSKFYASLITSAPNFLGWWYRTSDEPWRTDTMRHMIDRLNTQPLVRFIRDFDPHVTVCTHFMPAGIISHLIATGKLQAHLSIVVTDFDFHAMWLSRSFHRYFVALDETRAFLEMLGLPPERITVSGIPIDQRFGLPLDREGALRRHELNPELPTLLLSAGALGQDEAAFTVERLLALRHDVQVIVVCGRNGDLRQRIEDLTAQCRQRYRVLGYTDDMHHWMKLSDLYIGKPGGLTSSEVAACG